MSKKKKTKPRKKSANKTCNKSKNCTMEKTYGDPMPVKPLTYVNGEPYPKLIFRKDNLWIKFLRLIGYLP